MRDFKPLGYKFEVSSPMSLAAAKHAIRDKKRGWFEPKNGPRGWIAGPVICLWMSAFDRHGPMVIAIIRNDGFRTRIFGRAGADLNGMMLFVLLTPLMAWLTWQIYEHGQGTIQGYLVFGLVFGLGLPLTLWVNSEDRHHADPLVRFLKQTVGGTH